MSSKSRKREEEETRMDRKRRIKRTVGWVKLNERKNGINQNQEGKQNRRLREKEWGHSK